MVDHKAWQNSMTDNRLPTIFSINYYLTKPEIGLDQCYSEFRCTELKQVPVLRVFGSTQEGQKSCLHIHNVFPYFLIKLNKTITTKSELDKYLYDFANQIEHVLNAALCIRDHINSQHIYKIEPVMTKSMYGYHEKDSIFLKISLINPDLVRKLSELLLNGNIMNESFQPYESHVPYNLQFLIDHNLFGMNLIYLETVKFRRESTDLSETLSSFVPRILEDSQGTKWNVSNMCDTQLLRNDISRQSTCELELDALASDILNAHMDKDGYMLNPGLSALWEEEKKRREYFNLNVPMETPDLEERKNILTVDNETEFKNRLINLLETRFNEPYPFKVDNIGMMAGEEEEKEHEANKTIIYNEVDDCGDESILNILDELHNNSDLDGSMLYPTQLNEEDKEEILKENLHMTQVQITDQEIDSSDGCIDRKLLDDLNKSSNSSSSSCNTSIQEINDKKPNLTLIEELINSSDDEKITEKKVLNLQKDEILQINSSVDVSHNCSYFEKRDEKFCTHIESISQSFCINCDHVSEIRDSLDYMAFVSPDKSTINLQVAENKKWTDFLKFDSPTISQVEPEINDINHSMSIIDETITDTTILENQTQKSTSDDSDDEIKTSYSKSQSQSSKSMISEISIYWSDSDNSVKDDHFLETENKNELKRRKALETIDKNESELIEETDFCDKNKRINRLIGLDEGWFCPSLEPPLKSEIGSDFIANNQPIVQFLKKDKKFNMKLNIPRFKDRLEEFENLESDKIEYYRSIDFRVEDNILCWFTPAIPLPSARRIRQTFRNSQNRLEKNKKDRQKVIEQNLTNSFNQKSASGLDVQPVKTSILYRQDNEKKRKRKSVRFNETTILHNESFATTSSKNLIQEAEKGHLQASEYFKDPNELPENIQIAKKMRSSQLNDTLLDTTSNESSQSYQSFYEYDSILFPKASKFVDFFTVTQNDSSQMAEKDETKEAKKDKKIVISDKTKNETQTAYLTLMSLELHVNTRGDMQPNPEIDTIRFICYTIYNQKPTIQNLFDESHFENHLLVFDTEKRSLASRRFLGTDTKSFLNSRFKSVSYVYKEEDLFESIIQAILFHDPDILVGFEIQKLSWCYLCRRAMTLNLNEFCNQISRLPKRKRESVMRIVLDRKKNVNAVSKQAVGSCEVVAFPQDLHIAGRVVLNLWRVIKSEVALNIYTFENCCYHILKERTAKYGYAELNNWFEHRSDLYRWRTIDYYLYRAQGNLKLMGRLDLVGKTTEFAKVYGIEFYHVISRGSQYRVESMMLRIARKLNFIALSASQKQKAQMRAAECIPLTLEPESKFYTDPVAILDYQSLYPSVIIAFNICFSTCLGRIELIGKEGCFKFGCSSLFLPDKLLKSLDIEKDIYIAPNGIAFVKRHVRKGILPIMLEDILKTRFMVKNSMKLHKDDNLYKIFDSRQMSLKLIANVTFGYTAANFSGRMPCVEVGDSIVRVARQSLEMSIKYIHENEAVYRGRVVYGDTDSLFVLFDKINKLDAFNLSYAVVDKISSFFPKPLKLKFEKIYYPSILLAKKRYIGYMFETPEQNEGIIDAKGVEIVRRDGCPIASKILERSCKILFEFKDPNKVKDYVIKQCTKLVNGKINIKECVIAKEYRGRDSYSNAKSIASCQIANRATAKDPMAEPLVSERVPYVIIYGSPNRPLFELVRSPVDLIQNQDLKLNYEYYVMKQILPPVDRIMVLLGVNAFEWVKNLSFKPKIFQSTKDLKQASTGVSISNYIYLTDCVLCGRKLPNGNNSYKLCHKCKNLDQIAHTRLRYNFQKYEKKFMNVIKICQMCTGTSSGNHMIRTECVSIDCPNNLLILNAGQELQKTEYIRSIIDEYF